MLFSKVGGLATKALIAASILTASTSASASAAACQAGPGGCVLPIGDAPPPPPMSSAPPPFEAAPVAEVARGGLSLLAILAGIAALGLLAYLFLDNDDDEDGVPISPG
jgi:hypothetical protein